MPGSEPSSAASTLAVYIVQGANTEWATVRVWRPKDHATVRPVTGGKVLTPEGGKAAVSMASLNVIRRGCPTATFETPSCGTVAMTAGGVESTVKPGEVEQALRAPSEAQPLTFTPVASIEGTSHVYSFRPCGRMTPVAIMTHVP